MGITPFNLLAGNPGSVPAQPVQQDLSVPVQAPSTPAPTTSSPAPLSTNIAQNTLVANQKNPGQWAQNLVAGVMSALSGFGVEGQAPVGAGIFSGIGKAAQMKQAQNQLALENKRAQQKQDMEKQQQDREFQLKSSQEQREQQMLVPTIAEANARTALNTAQAERLGEESLKDQIEIGRPLISTAEDNGLLDARGVTQTDLMAGLKSGKYHPGETLGPVDGYTYVTGPDGKEHLEATHAVLKDAGEKVPLSQADVDRFKAAHVPGFDKIGTVAPDQTMTLGQLGLATQQAASNKLFDTTLNNVNTTLGKKAPDQSPLADPGMVPAVQKFSHYIGASGGDPFKALVAMSQQTHLDPKTGTVVPNPDASSARKLVDAFGGWDDLQKYEALRESKVKEDTGLNADRAMTIVSAPAGQYAKAEVKQARDFLAISNKQAVDKEVDKFVQEGKGTEQMYKLGKDPVTGQKLTLDNAPGEMLVNEATGQPIPISYQTILKPTQQEVNRGDFAGSVLHSLDLVDKLKAAGKLPNGPISGLTAQQLANAGLGSDSQEAIDLLKFAQSAATGAHVGGRFSQEIMKKMDTMISLNMNDKQFSAAEKGIRDVMEQYAQQGGRMTVDQYRQMQLDKAQAATNAATSTQKQNPPTQKFGTLDPSKIPGGVR